MDNIKLYHFYSGSGGGVWSVIKNLLRYSTNAKIENHIIHAVNKTVFPNYTIEPVAGAASQALYFYSPKDNFYHTCREMVKFLPDEKALVVAHDWLELGMMSNLGLQNPVVQFLHGDYDYYYALAKKHELIIDRFICVADHIATKLSSLLPGRNDAISYLRFPVPDISGTQLPANELNIIFIGRLTKEKGYPLLPVIARLLSSKNTEVRWHIVGAYDGATGQECWGEISNVHFYGNLSNEVVLALLPGMQLLILPSLAEGMPVVLAEAMKAGVIPLVNDITGGIQELVINGDTGFKIKNNEPEEYVEKVILLAEDKKQAEKMKLNCMEKAHAMFEPFQNTTLIEAVFQQVLSSVTKRKRAKKAYGSRLDQPWLPNNFTKLIRRIK